MKQLLCVLLFAVSGWLSSGAQVVMSPCADGFDMPTDEKIGKQLTKSPEADPDFVVRSNFLLDRLLWGGQVERGDSLSAMANRVVKQLLRDDSLTQCNIHVYTLRSSDVNAWTFDRGVILVTTGLYARLENEAQLAFILAHEINHYKNKHALNTYALQSCDDLQRCSAPERLNRINRYSRENEMEADREGIALMRKAGYDVTKVTSVFDLLQYAYLPVREVKFRKNYFEDDALVFPSQYFLGIVNEIVRRDVVNDTSGTHPTIRKRRVVADFLRDSVQPGYQGDSVPPVFPAFIVSNEESFLRFRKTAGTALGRQLLCEARYRDALYHAYAMQELWPDVKPEAELLVAQSLYGIAMLRATLRRDDDEISNFTRYAGVQGEMQQVYYLFSKLGAMESAVLALHYNWKCSEKYPQVTLLTAQRERLLKLVTGFYRLAASDFEESGPPSERQQVDQGDDVRGEVYAPRPSYDFHKYAFSGLFKTGFKKAFMERVGFYSTHSFIDEITSHDHPLSHLILFDPFIKVTDADKPEKEFFYAEEAMLHQLQNKFGLYGDVDSVLVSKAHGFLHNPCNALNERMLLSQYVNERLLTGQLFFPAPAGLAALEELQKGNTFGHTRYILLSGITTQQQFKTTDLQSKDPAAKGMGSNTRTAYFALLIDAQTGRLLLNDHQLRKKPLNDAEMTKWVDGLWKKIRAL